MAKKKIRILTNNANIKMDDVTINITPTFNIGSGKPRISFSPQIKGTIR